MLGLGGCVVVRWLCGRLGVCVVVRSCVGVRWVCWVEVGLGSVPVLPVYSYGVER